MGNTEIGRYPLSVIDTGRETDPVGLAGVVPYRTDVAQVALLKDGADWRPDLPLRTVRSLPSWHRKRVKWWPVKPTPLPGPLSDRDGDTLTYMAEYSADGGITWTTLDIDLSSAEFQLPVALLAGSKSCLLRVLASDGFNTSVTVSDLFEVATKQPQVTISAPTSLKQEPVVYQADQHLILRGSAWDAEDGTLDDAALTWSSDISSTLSTGRSIAIWGLPLGTHTLTLAAVDSDGFRASDSVQVEVVESLAVAAPLLYVAPAAYPLC